MHGHTNPQGSIKCGEGRNFLTCCQDLLASQGLCFLEWVRQLVSSLVRVNYQFLCRGLVFGDLEISVGQLLNAQPVDRIQEVRYHPSSYFEGPIILLKFDFLSSSYARHKTCGCSGRTTGKHDAINLVLRSMDGDKPSRVPENTEPPFHWRQDYVKNKTRNVHTR